MADHEEFVTRGELHAIVKQATTEALAEYQHECVLNLDPEEVKQVSNLFENIRTVGHGDLRTGVNVMRENHSFVERYRKYTGHIGTTVITLFILGVISLVWKATESGIISWIGKVKE